MILATITPRIPFDTLFLLSAYKFVLQAVSAILLKKAEKKKRRCEEIKEEKEAELARMVAK